MGQEQRIMKESGAAMACLRGLTSENMRADDVTYTDFISFLETNTDYAQGKIVGEALLRKFEREIVPYHDLPATAGSAAPREKQGVMETLFYMFNRQAKAQEDIMVYRNHLVEGLQDYHKGTLYLNHDMREAALEIIDIALDPLVAAEEARMKPRTGFFSKLNF